MNAKLESNKTLWFLENLFSKLNQDLNKTGSTNLKYSTKFENKIVNNSTFDNVPLKCVCIKRGLFNGRKQPTSFSFALNI